MQALTGNTRQAMLLRLHCAIYMILNKEELVQFGEQQRWNQIIATDFSLAILQTLQPSSSVDMMAFEVISRVLSISLRSVMIACDHNILTNIEYNDVFGVEHKDRKTVEIMWTSADDMDTEGFEWNHFVALVPKIVREGTILDSDDSADQISMESGVRSDENDSAISFHRQQTPSVPIIQPDLNADLISELTILNHMESFQEHLTSNDPGKALEMAIRLHQSNKVQQ